MPSLTIPKQWTDLYNESGITQGSEVIFQNIGYQGDIIEVLVQDSQPLESDRGEQFDQLRARYRMGDGASKIWVKYLRLDRNDPPAKQCLIFVSDSSTVRLEQSLPYDVVSDVPSGSRRIQTENLTLNQRYIVDGVGFTVEWVDTVLVGGSVYAEFVVPNGFYMALDFRQFDTQGEEMYYFVFPESSYEVATYATNAGQIIDGNLRPDSSLSFSPLTRVDTLTTTPVDEQRILRVPNYGQAGSGSGNKAQGVLASDTIFRLIPPNSKFLLEVRNNGAALKEFQLTLVFAFIPSASVYPPA